MSDAVVKEEKVQNGLAEAMGVGVGGGISPWGMAGQEGWPGGQAISSANTTFINLRYYLVSNLRELLSQAYAEIGLIQTVCDVPVDDALRGGVNFKSQQLNADQLDQLRHFMDEQDDLGTAGQAAKWNRLFGGAGIIIITDADPEEPFDESEVQPGEEVTFKACDMWELFWDQQFASDSAAPLEHDSELFEHYTYYGHKIHKSRVMKLKGVVPPSFIRPRTRGWGLSVVEAFVRSLNQYLKATDLTFEVLDEFKIDVFKIKNLVNLLFSPEGEQKVRQRIAIANRQKNFQNALVMDSEDDWDHKQLNFSGLSDAQQGIRMQVASDLRMPMIKLFGTPAQGLNADDESSIEVYNSMVESQVRRKIKYDVLRMAKVRCQQLFGIIPDDLTAEFQSLRMIGAVEEENVKTQKFTRLSTAMQSGLITDEEFRDACNKGNLFDIKLETSPLALGEAQDYADERREAASNVEDEAQDVDDGKDDGKTMNAAVAPYSRRQRVRRRIANSAAYDRASYALDGGDAWIDERRADFFTGTPLGAEAKLWAKALAEAGAAGGDWRMAAWLYRKLGGKYT